MSYGAPSGDAVAFSFTGDTYFSPAGDGANFSFVPVAPTTPEATVSAQVVLACSASGVRGVSATVLSGAVRCSVSSNHGVSAVAAVQIRPKISASVICETLVPSVVSSSIQLTCAVSGSACPYGVVSSSVSVSGSVKGDFASSLASVQGKIAIIAAAVGAVPPSGRITARLALSCAVTGYRGATTSVVCKAACRVDVRSWYGPSASAHCAVRLTAAAQGRAGNSGISSVVVAVHGAVEGRHLNPVLLAADCRIAISVEVCAEVVQKGRDTDAMFVLTAAEQLEVWTDV